MEPRTAMPAAIGLQIRENEPMSRHTNFRIGGPARYYVEARTADDVRAAVSAAREFGVPWFVLGGGSNTLVADAGYNGLVIQLANHEVRTEGTRVIAGAGAITAAVARAAGDAGLTGFEWAISLPGTIGGAVRGNAGCFGGEVKDAVQDVSVLETQNAEVKTQKYANAECEFRYRHSTFKEHPEWIILEVILALQPGDRMGCQRLMDEHLMRRKTKQPLERPSAGCLFANVEVKTLNAEQIAQLDRATGGAWRTAAHDDQIPTGWLIERLGLKGYRVGNAMISEKHGNFIINLGNGIAADVLAIVEHVKQRAREAYGIELREEVQRLGC
jgi:UDP-N-acetylmuramate dehydrogenase